MAKQRNLFFGQLPRKSPRKIGENKPVPERRMPRLRPEQLQVQFTSTAATACGGIPLWHGFLGRFGWDQLLESYLRMDRGPEAFTPQELSRFFVDARVLGAARLQHVDALRHDPVLTRCHGLDTLPSDETLGRYFKSFDPAALADLERLNTCLLRRGLKRLAQCRRWSGRPGPLPVVLDFDSSTFPVYGTKEGADRGRSFRYKDSPGFQPKFAFIGGLGALVHQELYPESVNLSKDFEAFEAAARKKLPHQVRVWAVRGDGALYSETRIKRYEKDRLVYGISAPLNAPLRQAIAQIPEEDWAEDVDADGHYCSLARLRYQPPTWKRARTFIISRRLKNLQGQQLLLEDLRYEYFAYVTNYRARPKGQFKFCVERCSLENCIKEAKNGLHYGALPHAELNANLAYLAHVQAAYNALIVWKALEAPPEVNRYTIETLRARFLNVPGNLVRRAGCWVLSLPKRWPWQVSFRLLAAPACASP